jgi:hypothetical protein
MKHSLFRKPIRNLRERTRKDGSVRIWWEPQGAARTLGFASVELDEKRLTWSQREAEKLNAELDKALIAGRRDAPAASGRSLEALIEDYRRSKAWDRLAEKTRHSYNATFRLILRKWGSYPVKDFTKPVMYQYYETLRENSGEHIAAALIRSMSLLFSHAERTGWRAEGSNPCQRLGIRTPQPRHRSASWAEIDALVAAADAMGLRSMATAILLSVFQGQRQTDIILAEADEFTRANGEWVWALTRSKRGNEGAFYLHEEVAARVAGAVAAAQKAGRARLLHDDRTGQPYSPDLFAKRWQAVRAAAIEAAPGSGMADLAGLQFRDLRRTFGVLSRGGGASKDDAADVLGNSAATNPRLGKTYMPAQLETASRAIRSIKRPQPEERRKA